MHLLLQEEETYPATATNAHAVSATTHTLVQLNTSASVPGAGLVIVVALFRSVAVVGAEVVTCATLTLTRALLAVEQLPPAATCLLTPAEGVIWDCCVSC